MKPLASYTDYTDMLQHLTHLHIEWRNAESDAARHQLFEKISVCRAQLMAITEKLIQQDAFADRSITGKPTTEKSII